MLTVKSKNGVPIRLTDERWQHIVAGHGELSECKVQVRDTIAEPEVIYKGRDAEYLAVKKFDESKKIVVVYSEFIENDGFVITAFITSKIVKLEKLEKLWPL